MTRQLSERRNIVADAAALAQAAAAYFLQAAQRYVAERGRFTVALSGGSTPKAMFALLAASPYRAAVPWEQVYFFWGDERCVPPAHPESNYRMTHELLLSQVPVPDKNIYRIKGEADPAEAAQEYTEQLQDFFQTELPSFDLILLGMGADGHTASLFPFTTALHSEEQQLVVENYVEKLNAHRITLTAALINHAQEIVFLVGGSDKAATVKAVLQGAFQPELYPSQLIQPHNGSLIWLLDEAAAAELG